MKPILNSLARHRPHSGMLVIALMLALAIVHLTLYPYVGWRHIGIGPFEFLSGPWVPAYQKLLWGDIALNVLAYIPLGFFLLLGLSSLPGKTERLVAPLVGLILSLGLESLQTLIPSRVPSKMDVLTNFMGAVIGSLLAVMLTKYWSKAKTLNYTLRLWLIERAWLGIGLLCLWFLALTVPRQPEFVLGPWLGNWLDVGNLTNNPQPLGAPEWFILSAEQWIPSLGNFLFLLAMMIIVLGQARPGRPRMRLVFGFTLLSLAVYPLHLAFSEGLWAWLVGLINLAQKEWLAIGGALTATAWIARTKLPPGGLALLGVGLLMLGWALTLFLPGVYPPELQRGGQGVVRAYRTLQQAGLVVGDIWPLFGLIVLLALRQDKVQNTG